MNSSSNVCTKIHIVNTFFYGLTFFNQEQATRVQTQLNEEELKNSKLLQQIAKLEEQITVIAQESDHKDEVNYFLVFHI